MTFRPRPAVSAPFSLDVAHLLRQREFSVRTFGPQSTRGVIDHIRRELEEIPGATTPQEWADVILLGFDGAMRDGWEPQVILDAVRDKLAENMKREWPDWRTADPDKAIEHVLLGGTWTKGDIKIAYAEGARLGATHMLVAYDDFDQENYPIYVMPGQDPQDARPTNGDKVDECYRYVLGWEFQSQEKRAEHWEYDKPEPEQQTKDEE